MSITRRIKSDGSFSYIVRVRDSDGRFFESATFHSESEAGNYHAVLLEKREQGMRAMTKVEKKERMSDYYKVWSQFCRDKVSDGWKISQDQMFRDYIEPFVGHKAIGRVKSADISLVFFNCQKVGLSGSTQRNIYKLLSRLFNDAASFFSMPIESPIQPRFHEPKANERKPQFLTPDQTAKLLAAARGDWAETAINLQVHAGLRREAVVPLQWNDVNLDAAQIVIRRAYKYKVRRVEEFPKEKRQNYVPINKVLLEFLKEKKAHASSVFVSPAIGGGMMSADAYYCAVKRLCHLAGVPIIGTHGLRHSCSELWINAGATSEDIRRLLNHRSAHTTERYIHRSDERLRAIGDEVVLPKLRLVGGA